MGGFSVKALDKARDGQYNEFNIIVQKKNKKVRSGPEESMKQQGEENKKELLKVNGIKKRFGQNIVLKGIDLEIHQGEVLALIGGNGAGKSTLMKIIMGIYHPDEGKLFICGEKITSYSPAVMLEKGVYMIPQEPLLFPNMSVEENILMGFKEKKSILRKRLKTIMDDIGWKLSLERKAFSLSIAEQQLVEILRGLLRDANVLILDEPTSALTFDEVESLFRIVEGLKEKGIGIIYITHRLAEVFEISTQVAIMRDGVITLQAATQEVTREMLVQGLLPANCSILGIRPSQNECCEVQYESLEPIFRLEGFSGYGFEDIDLEVYPGEILGVAGLVGAGRTELATTIFGRDPVLAGKAILKGKDITGLSTEEVIRAGINYVPEDRRQNGLFGMSSVAFNTTSSLIKSESMGRIFLNTKEERRITQKYIDDFRTKVTGQHQEAGSLSGGNQQKIVIGRSLSTCPGLLILDEPTRGIDAAARCDVYAIIKELKKQGVGIMLISSDMEEIIELCDRAIVMFQGHKRGDLSKSEISQTSLMNASFDFQQNTAERGRNCVES